MRFIRTAIEGLLVIELDRIGDERGFFARTWCADEFEKEGLNPRLEQCNLSWNRLRGTLRGMHYQAVPHEEAKLIRCTRGAVRDVVVDVREDSATRGHWEGFDLSADNRRMLYVAEGLAHGFQTLVDDTELFYQMSTSYHAPSARGVRWNDPKLRIDWPLEPVALSERDSTFPDFAS